MQTGSPLLDKRSFKEEESVNLEIRAENSFFEESNQFFQVFSELEIGIPLSNAGSFQKLPEAVSLQDHASGDIFEQGGNYYKTNTVEGNVVAGTPLTDVAFELLDSTAVSLESHASGDIFEQGGNYYKTNTVEGSVVAGTPLTDVAFELLDPAVSWLNRLPEKYLSKVETTTKPIQKELRCFKVHR